MDVTVSAPMPESKCVCRRTLATCLFCVGTLAACESEGFVAPASGVTITFVNPVADTPDGIPRYSLVCDADSATSPTVLVPGFDAPRDPPGERAFVDEGELMPTTRDVAGVATEVWGVTVYNAPTGPCTVVLRPAEPTDCAPRQDFNLLPQQIQKVDFFPVCAGRLCVPHGDASLGFRVPDGYSTVTLDAALQYNVECSGSIEGSEGEPCDSTSAEGAVGMAGGPHAPHIGPIQEGRWTVVLRELVSGRCTARVSATIGGTTSVCDSTVIFDVPVQDTIALEDLILTCDAQPHD